MNTRPVIRTRTGTYIGKLTLLVFAVWLSAAPAFAQRKGGNFGGLPSDLYDRLVQAFSGVLDKPITQQNANDMLVRLLHEEHAGANPGPGVTGFLDAFLAIEEVRIALEAFQKQGISEIERKDRFDTLGSKISLLGEHWKVGPPMPGFFGDPIPPKKQ